MGNIAEILSVGQTESRKSMSHQPGRGDETSSVCVLVRQLDEDVCVWCNVGHHGGVSL